MSALFDFSKIAPIHAGPLSSMKGMVFMDCRYWDAFIWCIVLQTDFCHPNHGNLAKYEARHNMSKLPALASTNQGHACLKSWSCKAVAVMWTGL